VSSYPNKGLRNGINKAAIESGSPVAAVTQRNIEAIARLERESEASRTVGEWLADKFALVVGSWSFIVVQTVLLLIWMTINAMAWAYKWDPYPFILLNLALSFQAAFASPIIMMSQNRQARLAEKRNRLDLQINLLAEQENTELLRMVRKLCEQAGINLHEQGTGLEEDTAPEVVARQIDEAHAADLVKGEPPNSSLASDTSATSQ
jgi:uncharacterized membrane protein